jgi:AcrR family transcriptional regulator
MPRGRAVSWHSRGLLPARGLLPVMDDRSGAASRRGGSLRRQEIFRIAADIFYRKGYAQTSTRDIAEAAGILKGSLYAHISSKEDILDAIVQDVHRLFESNVAACEALDAPPLDRLRSFLAGHMRVALSELEYHQVYTRDWRSLSGAVPSAPSATNTRGTWPPCSKRRRKPGRSGRTSTAACWRWPSCPR